MKKTWIIGISIVVLISLVFFTKGFGVFNASATGAVVVGDAGVIEISLSEISENAQGYSYKSGKTAIKYFAVKADDGSIKTGFDACDVCYGSKKGYRQEGKFMVCNNCGNRYPISGLGTENKNPGGCWPGYLPSKVKDGNLVIEKSDLAEGKWWFE